MSDTGPTVSPRGFDAFGGFVAATGVGLGLPLLLSAADLMTASGTSPPSYIVILTIVVFSGGVVALATTLMLALPVYAILRRTSLLGPASSALAGAIVGAPASALWVMTMGAMGGSVGGALTAVFPLAIAAPGFLAGIVFWRVATRQARLARLQDQVEVF